MESNELLIKFALLLVLSNTSTLDLLKMDLETMVYGMTFIR